MKQTTIIKLALTISLIAGGGGFLIYSSYAEGSEYKMVDELMKDPSGSVDKALRVHGWVRPGSIVKQIVSQETHHTFVLQKGGKEILVEFVGPTPDTFRDQSEVVANGTLRKRGETYVLEAKELMAKCPSKYEGAPSNKAMKAEDAAAAGKDKTL